MCFLLPGWGWHETEEERGIGTGPVEGEGAGPVLRATGGSEEPLSISDTEVRTGICCWEEAMALRRRNVMTDLHFFCPKSTPVRGVQVASRWTQKEDHKVKPSGDF